MRIYLQDMNFHDWNNISRSNEQEITLFFESIIKAPLSANREFKSEVSSYMANFSKSLQEMDQLTNRKILQIFVEDLFMIIRSKFNEMRELITAREEVSLFQQAKRRSRPDA